MIPAALPGDVVSNPIPRKTTLLSRFSLAVFRASSIEKTIRMSQPSALIFSSEELEPGTLIRSPNVVMITSSRRPNAIAWSINFLLETQTGHPGPESKLIVSGSKVGMPNFCIAMV